MRRNKMKHMILFITIMLLGCNRSTDADVFSYGESHKITMYNGGQLVREWKSTGKVTSISNSDGWQFMDKKTGKLVRVGGDVIIEVLGK
jgi:hypothetical protein